MTVNCMTSGLMGPSATIQWGTPKELFDKLDNEFHFTLDVCASDGMEMCERYFNPEVDGLKQDWGGGRGMLDESTLRKGDREVGEEGSDFPSSNSRVIASQDGHTMVSGLGATIRFGDSLHKRKGEVQGSFDRCAIPIGNSDLEHSEDSEIRGD